VPTGRPPWGGRLFLNFSTMRNDIITLLARTALVAALFYVTTRTTRADYDRQKLAAATKTQAIPESSRALDLVSVLMLHRSEHARFVDVREPEQWRRGHIRGAINLPLSRLKSGSAEENRGALGNEANLVVYCERSSCIAAPVAARLISHLGLKNVAVYGGGWDEWKSLGLPHETN
jgi:rhodanese-related sulfurtransferase